MNMNLVQVSTHSFKYRNFQIIKLPAKAMSPVTRFHVQRDDNSFGLFDSMNDAIKYIDSLFLIVDELPFYPLIKG
ncbi:hypothetical protein [Providencia alcalifaciens]|uniref:hypothetical protein n=1 Tax=Providencia alcalifaciens TaxID=126385 RepID=UPI00044D5120|nr:hypothetical protein [Providencia alcalifaciens]EUC93756.1 hypothetical protein HMPREF1567_0618 [Providencia alcalifaciens PAL-2]CAG9412378.1 hypothetical protein NVI2019_KOLGMIGM_00849 [Providencia alcalifaciens]CAG9413348.1 hypothetical protein NVI2019_OGMBKCAO_00848 [Providencia alcalifaciens]CAG9413495.1 hypothetical protein NVI2019_ANGEOOBF_00848 [Providencia alcalifaciens]CAG9428611.1 hypothetical protein NVI2019_PLFLNFOB_02968 [Providencia alcalifaciens]